VRPRAVASILFQSFWFIVVVAIASVDGARPDAAGQAAHQESRPLAIDSLGATDSYVFYCAPCHGRSGKGDGPVAPSLRARPADLSTLDERNGGTFPRERIAAYITGIRRPITAHGTSEMPVWGPAFRALDATDRRAAARVSAIVDHLQSLQSSGGIRKQESGCRSGPGVSPDC
jgi:cytochrome c553